MMKIKHMWIAFAVFLIAIVGFRTYQVMYLIDPITGFLPIKDITIYILVGAMIAYIIVLLLISNFIKQKDLDYSPQKNTLSGIFSLAASVLLFVDLFDKIWDYVLDYGDSSNLILLIFSFLGALNFLLLAISSFSAENVFDKVPVLSTGACLWSCSRVVDLTFLKHNNILGISYNMLNIVGVLTLIVFLFTQAKLMSGVVTKDTSKRCVMLGLLTVVFMSTYLFPNLIFKVNAGKSLSFNNMMVDITDIFIVLYITVFCVELTRCFNEIESQTISNKNDFFYANNNDITEQKAKPIVEETVSQKMKTELDDAPIKRYDKVQDPKDSDGQMDMNYINQMVDDIVSKDK